MPAATKPEFHRYADDNELTDLLAELQTMRKKFHEQFMVEEATLHRHPSCVKQLLTASSTSSSLPTTMTTVAHHTKTKDDEDKNNDNVGNKLLPNAPPAVDSHRTLDQPTLTLLKSVNYPFSLCEEAPSSYTPPPVPFDVENEVEQLKRGVLQVQKDLQLYVETSLHSTPHVQEKTNTISENNCHLKGNGDINIKNNNFTSNELHDHEATPSNVSEAEHVDDVKRENNKRNVAHDDLLTFFSDNAPFAELAWSVSSLQWFYRWVLSHSISLLWNAKEQLEYVLTEANQSLPNSVEEMDSCLNEYPFSVAVAILDNDRQMVIEEERRKLNTTLSRTYKDRLPANAVKMATSCYLTAEEKYMYQEFYNQSEHLILLLRHSQLLYGNEQSSLSESSKENDVTNNKCNNKMKVEQISGSNYSGESMANNHELKSNRTSMNKENTNLVETIKEVKAALKAEKEILVMLFHTIAQRREKNVFYDISEEEYTRSRHAAIAVYGCVASDVSLMAFQMNIAAEFLNKYEEWLRYHGFATHDVLMSELCNRNMNARWPLLVEYTCQSEHSNHFIPPTSDIAQMEWMRLNSNVAPEVNLLVRDNSVDGGNNKPIAMTEPETSSQQNKKIISEPFLSPSALPPSERAISSSHKHFSSSTSSSSPLSFSNNAAINKTNNDISSRKKDEQKAVVPSNDAETQCENTHESQQDNIALTSSEATEIKEAEQVIDQMQPTITSYPTNKSEEKTDKLISSRQRNTLVTLDENTGERKELINDRKIEYHEKWNIVHILVQILHEIVNHYTSRCTDNVRKITTHFSLWEVWLAICEEFLFVWCSALQHRMELSTQCRFDDKNDVSSIMINKTERKVEASIDAVQKRTNVKKMSHSNNFNTNARLQSEAQIIREQLWCRVQRAVVEISVMLKLSETNTKVVHVLDLSKSEEFVFQFINFTNQLCKLWNATDEAQAPQNSAPFIANEAGVISSFINNSNNNNNNKRNSNVYFPHLSIPINTRMLTHMTREAKFTNCTCDESDESCYNLSSVSAFVLESLKISNVVLRLRVHEMLIHNDQLTSINSQFKKAVDLERNNKIMQQKLNEAILREVRSNKTNNYSSNTLLTSALEYLYLRPVYVSFVPISNIYCSFINDCCWVTQIVNDDDDDDDHHHHDHRYWNSIKKNNIVTDNTSSTINNKNNSTSANIKSWVPHITVGFANVTINNNEKIISQEEQHKKQVGSKEIICRARNAVALRTLLSEHYEPSDNDKQKSDAYVVLASKVRYALARWVICAFNMLERCKISDIILCANDEVGLISLIDYIFVERASEPATFVHTTTTTNGNNKNILPHESITDSQIFTSLAHNPLMMYILSPWALHVMRILAMKSKHQLTTAHKLKHEYSLHLQIAQLLHDIMTFTASPIALSPSIIPLAKAKAHSNASFTPFPILQFISEQIKDDVHFISTQEVCEHNQETLENNDQCNFKDKHNVMKETKYVMQMLNTDSIKMSCEKQVGYASKRLKLTAVLEQLDDYIVHYVQPEITPTCIRESIYTGDTR